ncbi:MAG: TlpA disulfide reductase family protein [Pseudomonadota bacterium]
MNRYLYWMCLFIVAIAAFYIGIKTYTAGSPVIKKNNITAAHQTFLSASLKDSKDKTHSLKEWKGKTIVVNFWATWCAPCKKEIPDLNLMRQKWKSRDVEFIGIAIDYPEDVARFLISTPITYPSFVAPDQGLQFMQLFGNTQGVLPFSIIMNKQQSSFETIVGTLHPEDLNTRLTKFSTEDN